MTALRSIGRGNHSGPAPQIAIVNYGMGNLLSVRNALRFLGYESKITSDADTLAEADALVLPGVGAFGEAIANLNKMGLDGALSRQVLDCQKPFLGICLGMQLIAQTSEELGQHNGLGWIEGHVKPLPDSVAARVPHVGWSEVSVSKIDDPLFENVRRSGCFFFDHSFHLECQDGFTTAVCQRGPDFVAAVRHGNILATQFHPERSQRAGLQLLRNFLNMCEVHCGNVRGSDIAAE